MVYGVSPVFTGESSGGIGKEGLQIAVTNRAIELAQGIYNQKVLAWILDQFGVQDWKFELTPSERRDKLADMEVQRLQIEIAERMKALGFDADKVDVLIHQFVTILEKGEVVKMSTRKANYITLDELTESVGKDVVRYFFIMRGMKSHLNFDLELAKTESEENPVFYLQYAHARISSILRNADFKRIKLYRALHA